jgi:hypothetical protein
MIFFCATNPRMRCLSRHTDICPGSRSAAWQESDSNPNSTRIMKLKLLALLLTGAVVLCGMPTNAQAFGGKFHKHRKRHGHHGHHWKGHKPS